MSKVNQVDSSRPLEIAHRNRFAGKRILNRLPDGVEEKPYSLFQVNPLSPLIGAEIEGVDLRAPLHLN